MSVICDPVSTSRLNHLTHPLMKSKFRTWTYLPFLLAIFLMVYSAFVLRVAIFETEAAALLIYVGLFTFMIIVWTWVVFGELRTKTLVIHLDGDSIVVRGFLGFGPVTRFELRAFDGFTTSLLPSRYRDFEFLYLMKDNKKLVKISGFYHSNYHEMKQYLAERIVYLGDTPYSFMEELKEVFQ